MKHIGDITKIDWSNIEPTDVVGGSPCQDLSIAGKRAGLSGERSGLFMEQIRCVKELRKKDEESGRTGINIRPRFMVWENVDGARSSPGGDRKGEDFAAVLEEVIKVCERGADVHVRIPKNGWPKAGCYYADDKTWSLAWRVHDAQYWGVAQRRRRIALVVDFGGMCAPEVLFESESMPRSPNESKEARENTATSIETSAGEASGNCNRGVKDGTVSVHLLQDPITLVEKTPCISTGNAKSGQAVCGVLQNFERRAMEKDVIPIHDKATRYKNGGPTRNGDGAGNGLGIGRNGDPSPTLSTCDCHAVFCLQGNGIERNDNAGCAGKGWREEVSYTLNTIDRHAVCAPSTKQNNDTMHDQQEVIPPQAPFDDRKNAISFQERAGKPGGGKGILIQNERTDALSTVNNQNEITVAFKSGQGAKAGGIGFQEECTPTLAGTASGTNQVPTICRFSDNKKQASALDCRNMREQKELSGTLQSKESGGYSLNYQNPVFVSNEIARALKAKANCDFREDSETYPVQNDVVRRLTPKECERLQAFPDNWTKLEPIAEITDEDYEFWKKNLFEKAVREGKIRQNEEGVWEIWHYLTVKSKQFDSAKKCDENGGYWENTHKAYKHKSKEKMLQWYNRSFCNDSESPRYKAIGNSIALPFWHWLLHRISNLYDRTPTLGSLFDGIGGFPLCWESINGSNTARWASEIELFPIAVTRTRFSKD